MAEIWPSVTRRETKSSSRRGWQEVRDYTQREIQSREALIGAMKEDVVRELARLRVRYASVAGREIS